MARRKSTLKVILSPTATDEMFQIWLANVERYGVEHADDYEAFLKHGINALETEYYTGKNIGGFPELRRIILKSSRRRSSDGHSVIFEVDVENKSVSVLHVFHTKMDFEGRLKQDRQ